MKLLRIWLILVLGLLAGLAPLSAAVAATEGVDITITQAPGGVRLDYKLARPAKILRIGTEDLPVSGMRLRSTAKGQRLANGRVEADVAFRRASLLVEADTEDIDAHYPLLSPIEGRGFVLYAPYVVPAAARTVRVSVGDGRFRTLSATEAAGGFLLVGTEARAGAGADSLAASNSPPALADLLLDRAAALLAYYERQLGAPPRSRPTIVLAYSDPAAGGKLWPFRGDVSSNGFVLLRVSGSEGEATGQGAISRYTSLLSHELFHLWNRRSANVPDNEAWLHEGSADYFSWLAVSALWPTEASVERQVESAARGCALFYGVRPLHDMSAADGRLRYLCGAVAQWVVDVGVRHDSAGRLDGFDLWSELLAHRRPGADHMLADFRAAAARLTPATSVLLGDMIDKGTDWEHLMAALVQAGADVVTAPANPSTVRFVAARSLALSACGAFGGAGETSNGLYLTVPTSCTSFDGATVIELAEGVDPMAEPLRFYEKLAGSCSRRDSVSLQLSVDGVQAQREIRCTISVEPAPPQIRVRRALPG